MYQFRDPVHGYIEVSDLEMKIIDSQPFQRLRRIKQLATTYLVYHGAEHTRFGHSLGVMHLVDKAFQWTLNHYEKDTGKPLFHEVLRAWYLQILRLIALTHDLGHAPFSHGSEALFNEGVEHEDYTRKIICETEIAEYIYQIGKDFQFQYGAGSEYDITPELLWQVYRGEAEQGSEKDHRRADFIFLRSFMDSELDCDKMDYLLRDSYYCGVNYGNFDINRLLSSLTVYHKGPIMQLAVERGGIHAFEEFVIARYFMFIQVYFHKTRRYLDRLLVTSLPHILPEGTYPVEVNAYLKWDDELVMMKIREKADTLPCAAALLHRQVQSCVYQTNAHSRSADVSLFGAVLHQLRKQLKKDILVDSAEKLAHKIPKLEDSEAGSGKGIPIIVDFSDKPVSIFTESILLRNLVDPINMKRIYVEKQDADRAREIIKESFSM